MLAIGPYTGGKASVVRTGTLHPDDVFPIGIDLGGELLQAVGA
jgi:hypothetical protein